MLNVREDGSIDKRKRYSPAAALAAARKAGFSLTICAGTLIRLHRQACVLASMAIQQIIAYSCKDKSDQNSSETEIVENASSTAFGNPRCVQDLFTDFV